MKTNVRKLHRMENSLTRTHRDVFRKKRPTTHINTEINGLNLQYAHGTESALRGKSRIGKYAQPWIYRRKQRVREQR